MAFQRGLRGLILLFWLGCCMPNGFTQGSPPTFEKMQLATEYWSEGANFGDFNQDGFRDIVSGPYWFEGPEYSVQHAIYPPMAFPILGYSDHFTCYVSDLNGDGWDDVLTIGFPGQPAYWYENPQSSAGLWPTHLVAMSVGAEAATLTNLVGSTAPELIAAVGNTLGYFTPDVTSPTLPWIFHPVIQSPNLLVFLHGLGVGDINGDGRADVMTGLGWLEQPPSLQGDPPWTFRTYGISSTFGAQMFAYDIDGDSDADIVSSRSAHGYGLSWFKQVTVSGSISFIEHVILPSTPPLPGAVGFSQLHGLAVQDLDGDGLKDLITGKTVLAHLGNDPGALDPAVIYWFRLDRTTTPPTFTPQLIDTDSGIGRQVTTGDLSGDGHPDIVIGNKKGVFLFRRNTLTSDLSKISLLSGGSQTLTLNAGPQQANRPYYLFGSMSGTTPGITALGYHLPLNPDLYWSQVLLLANSPILPGFTGTLDASGTATASIILPPSTPPLSPILLHHAYVVVTQQSMLSLTSNPTPITIH